MSDACAQALAFGAEVEKPPRADRKGPSRHALWLRDPDGNSIALSAHLTDDELATRPAREMPRCSVASPSTRISTTSTAPNTMRRYAGLSAATVATPGRVGLHTQPQPEDHHDDHRNLSA